MTAWATMETAPKNGEPFLAWYESGAGVPFGTMAWRQDENKGKGRFHSFTMGTQSKHAVAWMIPGIPGVIIQGDSNDRKNQGDDALGGDGIRNRSADPSTK